MGKHGQHASASFDWYTPLEIVEPAHRLFGGFGLDPASCRRANQIVRATEFYSSHGLERVWKSRIVWCNAPSKCAESRAWEWWVKGARAWACGDIDRLFFLVFNPSSFFQVALTHSLAENVPTPQDAARVEFTKRVCYLRPDLTPGDAPPHGSALLLLTRSRGDMRQFADAYAHLGRCTVPLSVLKRAA